MLFRKLCFMLIGLPLFVAGCASAPESRIEASVSSSQMEQPKERNYFSLFQFETGKAIIHDDKNQVHRLTRLLAYHGSIRLKLVGHADVRGGEEENLMLSKRRVDAVKAALVKAGVHEDRIDTAYLGEDEPLCKNQTEEGMACNRSVAVYLK